MAHTSFCLRIYHDHLTEGATAKLPKARRVIYCVAGQATLSAPGKIQTITDDQAFFSDGECSVRGDGEGARLWRWELVAMSEPRGEIRAKAIKSFDAGNYEIELDTSVKRLMRLDRVSFPLGGEALTHIHAAPGVRCQIKGNLLVESAGARFRAWPGDSWVEHGPDPVYAKASDKEPSAFVRVMIVPEEYKGRSTITYVRPEDKTSRSRRATRVISRNRSRFDVACVKCLFHPAPARRNFPEQGNERLRPAIVRDPIDRVHLHASGGSYPDETDIFGFGRCGCVFRHRRFGPIG